MTIFGSGLATRRFFMGSSEALGSPSNFADNSMKPEPVDSETINVETHEATKTFDPTKPIEDLAMAFQEIAKDQDRWGGTVVLTNMIDAINNVAPTIRGIVVKEVQPELYGAMMCMPGFPEEALIVAFSHLVDNKD